MKYNFDDDTIKEAFESMMRSFVQIDIKLNRQELAQHWKDCEECKIKSFNTNIDIICSGELKDSDGEIFTPEYLEAIMEWAADKEYYERAAKIKSFIDPLKMMIKDGYLTIPPYNYY